MQVFIAIENENTIANDINITVVREQTKNYSKAPSC